LFKYLLHQIAVVIITPIVGETTWVGDINKMKLNQKNSRDKIVSLLVAWMLFFASAAFAINAESVSSDNEIIIGSSLPLQKEGKIIKRGIEAALRSANQTGGVNGRLLKLIALDDKKSISKSIANIKELQARTNIFLNIFTTGVVGTFPEDVIRKKLLIFGPDENTLKIQKTKYHYLIHTKPSVYEEIEGLIDFSVKVKKRKRIATFYVADETGIEGRNHVREILKKYGLKPVAEASHPRRMIDVEAAAKKIAAAQPNVIICIARRHATYNFIIQALNRGLTRTIFAGTSYLLPIQKHLKRDIKNLQM